MKCRRRSSRTPDGGSGPMISTTSSRYLSTISDTLMTAADLHTLRASERRDRVDVLDQTRLPHERVTVSLSSAEDAARAIRTMQVRGAPLIGATAAFGLALALRVDASDQGLVAAH